MLGESLSSEDNSDSENDSNVDDDEDTNVARVQEDDSTDDDIEENQHRYYLRTRKTISSDETITLINSDKDQSLKMKSSLKMTIRQSLKKNGQATTAAAKATENLI